MNVINSEKNAFDTFKAFLEADVENSWYGMMLYDNVYKGYSPEGKNTVNILVLQGYDHWGNYEEMVAIASGGRLQRQAGFDPPNPRVITRSSGPW